MRIALIDPFYEQSHRQWAEGLQSHSTHQIDIYSSSAHNWKWKMTGGTLEMAKQVNRSNMAYDLLLVTDMLNLPLFLSALNVLYQGIPSVLYFHENQITYPWSPSDQDVKEKRDHHYGFINYCSALVVQKVLFNSAYHQSSFLKSLPAFMGQFPDSSFADDITNISEKSSVLYLGLDLPPYSKNDAQIPIFLWNHRWEYDKNPDQFFNTLFRLKKDGYIFKVIVLGKSYKRSPAIFEDAKDRLQDEIIHFGFVASRTQYLDLLATANIMYVTSYQDFFGISIVEALSAGCYPILPDRLSYTEHIPPSLRDDHIYIGDEDVEMTINVIEEKLYLQVEDTSRYVSRYDWSNVIDEYDHLLSSVQSCHL